MKTVKICEFNVEFAIFRILCLQILSEFLLTGFAHRIDREVTSWSIKAFEIAFAIAGPLQNKTHSIHIYIESLDRNKNYRI